jgi:lipopolysaccharide transport system ATP-binding protein
MKNVAVRAEQLSKEYRIGPQDRYRTLGETLRRAVSGRPPSTPGRPHAGQIWALRDVSFEIGHGEVVGIIGRNGAGKSTLLKILSRITRPTSGRAEIHGRVGSLLEVGTGFHPELTGYENIYLNGAILGMREREVRSKLDSIVAFAEIEKFMDTPVKRYSSGMHMRLAFAVAAHLDPEILLVDEVLAVGDHQFQKKCLGKMGDVARSGRTVLFVSHNMSAIQALCSRALLLRGGRLAASGAADAVVTEYLREDSAGRSFRRRAPLRGPVNLLAATIEEPGPGRDTVAFSLSLDSRDSRACTVDLRLADGRGAPVGFASLGTLRPAQMVALQAGVNRVHFSLPTGQLAIGDYVVSLDVTHPDVEYYDRVENCLAFSVTRPPRSGAVRAVEQRWGYGSVELDLLDVCVQLADPEATC